jgi:transcriptional regulator
MLTQRQKIMELLSEGFFTLQGLSIELHMSVKDLLLHLPHVKKSIRPPYRFVIDPAECLICGYVFKDRVKLHSPGKSPRCRETRIKGPAYHIK